MAIAVSCPTWDAKESAEFLGLETQTLAAWRCSGRYSLPYVRVGRKIRYRISDLERFLESRTVGAVETD